MFAPILKILLALSAIIWTASCSRADVIYTIDLDSEALGIQNHLDVLPNQQISVAVEMQLPTLTTSVSIYSISILFDSSELTFVSGVSSPPSGFDFVSITPGLIQNAGVISGIEALTPSNGPVGVSTFTIATLQFLVHSPSGGLLDIDIQPFEDGVLDGTYNNDFSGPPLVVVMQGASISVVPEPSIFMLLLAGAGVLSRYRKRSSSVVAEAS